MVSRKKLRNCIRKETYRYFFDKCGVEIIWPKLVDQIGNEKFNHYFHCKQLENEQALLRTILGSDCITVSYKKSQDKDFLNRIEKLLGYQRGDRREEKWQNQNGY